MRGARPSARSGGPETPDLEEREGTENPDRITSVDWKTFLLVLGGSVLLHLLPPLLRAEPLFSDELQYKGMAADILRTGTHAGHIFYPCGYGYFAAAVSALFGPGERSVLLAQSLLAALLPPLIYLLARRAGLRRAAALSGAGIYLLFVQAFLHGGMYLSDTFFTALTFGALFLILWRPDPPLWMPIAAGLLLGWAEISRSIGLAGLFAGSVLLLGSAGGWKRRLRSALVLLGVASLPIAAVLLENQRAYGLAALEANAGVNLWIGNSAGTDLFGLAGGSQRAPVRLPQEGLAAYNRRATREAIAYVRGHPLRSSARALVRIGRLAGPNPGREILHAFHDRIPPLVLIGLHALGSFLLWGGVLLWMALPARRGRVLVGCACQALLYTVLVSAAVFVPRYRLPLLPFASVLFAAGIEATVASVRHPASVPPRRLRTAAFLVLVLAANLGFLAWMQREKTGNPAYWQTWGATAPGQGPPSSPPSVPAR